MGKVEIKIRKKILTPDNLQQYRNYPALLKKYERNKRFRRALKIFLYSLALTMFVLALIFLGMWKVLLDKKQELPKNSKTFVYLRVSGNRSDTVEFHLYKHAKTDSFYTVSYQYDTLFKRQYKLPVSADFNDTTYIDRDSTLGEKITFQEVKVIQIEGRDYTIIRYLVAHIGMDIDAFIFYSPNFGLLHIRSKTWGNYSRLIKTDDIKKDRIIKQLTESIESDKVFFTGRNP